MKIPVEELSAGQRFSKPVYIDNENLFVPEGLPIKDKDLERLKKWGISHVYSDGEILSEDLSSDLNTFFLQAFSSPAQKKITQSYDQLRSRLIELFGKIRGRDPVDASELNTIVDGVVKLLERGSNDVIQYMVYGMQGETGDVENALNTALLSALLAGRIQMPGHRLMNLVMAALLHDVGMLRVSREILNKKGALTPEERKQIYVHPVYSYRIVTRELRLSDEVGMITLQHQERWDGTGYPRRLSREQIRLEARIIAVSDSFVAMVSNRPYRSPMIGYTAMRNLLGDNGRRFDPEVLRTFMKVVGIYPIGSIVLLSDSSVCRVIENRGDAPLKPVVKVIIDAEGREYPRDDGPVIDLANSQKLFIARAVDANSLAGR